jgi:hypothetical protein
MKAATIFGIIASVGAMCSSPLLADQVYIQSPLSNIVSAGACSSQPIAVHGDAHLFIDISSRANSIHLNIHYNTQGVSGTGLTDGSKYQLNNGSDLEINTNGGLPFVTETNVEMNLIGQGIAPNFRMQAVLHTTVDANGNVTAQFTKISAVCH